MGLEKHIAYFNPRMKPNPLSEAIDGMWITREAPFVVVKVWTNDSERPKLSEEPPEIQAYSAYMARELYKFVPRK